MKVPKKSKPPASSRPKSDDGLPPLILGEGAWRDALDSGIEIIDDEDEIIDLD